MARSEPILELLPEWASKAQCKVTVRLAGAVLFVDALNPASAAARAKFVIAVPAKFGGLDPERLDVELMGLAAPEPDRAPGPGTDLAEVDVRRVVRPELFHAGAVSGLTVPVVFDAGERPSTQRTYLRWVDGRREVADPPNRLVLPDGSALHLVPDSGDPPGAEPPAWSACARHGWLGGAPAPAPARVFGRGCSGACASGSRATWTSRPSRGPGRPRRSHCGPRLRTCSRSGTRSRTCTSRADGEREEPRA